MQGKILSPQLISGDDGKRYEYDKNGNIIFTNFAAEVLVLLTPTAYNNSIGDSCNPFKNCCSSAFNSDIPFPDIGSISYKVSRIYIVFTISVV